MIIEGTCPYCNEIVLRKQITRQEQIEMKDKEYICSKCDTTVVIEK